MEQTAFMGCFGPVDWRVDYGGFILYLIVNTTLFGNFPIISGGN